MKLEFKRIAIDDRRQVANEPAPMSCIPKGYVALWKGINQKLYTENIVYP